MSQVIVVLITVVVVSFDGMVDVVDQHDRSHLIIDYVSISLLIHIHSQHANTSDNRRTAESIQLIMFDNVEILILTNQ